MKNSRISEEPKTRERKAQTSINLTNDYPAFPLMRPFYFATTPLFPVAVSGCFTRLDAIHSS